jgi:hypothetical protein
MVKNIKILNNPGKNNRLEIIKLSKLRINDYLCSPIISKIDSFERADIHLAV